MMEVDDRVLLEALKRNLSQELAQQRELLALAVNKCERLIANDITGLQDILSREEGVVTRCREQRSMRDDLLRRIARKSANPQIIPTLTTICAAAPMAMGEDLQRLGSELRAVVTELTATNDRNQSLLRSALAVCQEVLGAVAGVDSRDGYDRVGQRRGRDGSGGMMNFTA